MKLWKTIRRFKFTQVLRMGWTLLKHPLLIWPTWKGTKQTIKVCDRLFGKAHHKNGKENAFRHALWNILICQKSRKFTKSDEKSAKWAEIVTNMHEKMTKSDLLDMEMDLHNNFIGRMYYLKELKEKSIELTVFLLKKVENAQKVSKIEEIKANEKHLVYISD